MAKLELENLAEFKKMEGQALPVGEWIEVTQEMVNAFARATLDFQWIHIDVERSKKESPFKAPIAHGFMSVSLLSKMLEDLVFIKSAKMGVNYGLNKVRFPHPVPVGSRLRLVGEIQSVEPYGDNGVKTIWDCIVEIEGVNFYNNTFTESEKLEISEGEALLKIDSFALTSNNITYAVTGDLIGYWKFFPTQDTNGIIPVWGFAEVQESKVEGLEVGERVYGFFPTSNFLKVKVEKNNPYGLTDGAEHRLPLPKLYNYYSKVKNDITYSADSEHYISIFRPLFTTSFLNYHFLKDNKFFESDQIILTSASSKTALGIAFFLKKYQNETGKKVVGLTSKRNVEFVKSLGFYDEVIAYDDFAEQLTNNTSTIVDMAGNTVLLSSLSDHLKDKLNFVSKIGLTDWKAEKSAKEIPNSKFFFAPSFAQTKIQEWGLMEMNKKIAIEFPDFLNHAKKWMKIVEISKQEDFSNLFKNLLDGNINPSEGYIVTLFSK